MLFFSDWAVAVYNLAICFRMLCWCRFMCLWNYFDNWSDGFTLLMQFAVSFKKCWIWKVWYGGNLIRCRSLGILNQWLFNSKLANVVYCYIYMPWRSNYWKFWQKKKEEGMMFGNHEGICMILLVFVSCIFSALFCFFETWSLTHCGLNELSHTLYWNILILILGM